MISKPQRATIKKLASVQDVFWKALERRVIARLYYRATITSQTSLSLEEGICLRILRKRYLPTPCELKSKKINLSNLAGIPGFVRDDGWLNQQAIKDKHLDIMNRFLDVKIQKSRKDKVFI